MPVYATLKRFIDSLVRIFFREVEVSGLENVPAEGGGIVVSWHPNGLIDPALILSQLPRRVVFGARDGLFKVPGLGWLMRALGTVPIYRAVDAGPDADPAARRAANRRTLDALAKEITSGSFAALFPEGVSHDEPGLQELKTGVARLYYQARELSPPGRPPVILPVGLFYDRKDRFRSRAHVSFHPPIALPTALDVTPVDGEPESVAKARANALTELVDRELTDAVGATEDWATHDALHRVRSLLAAERLRRSANPVVETESTIEQESDEFAVVRAAYYAARTKDPARIAALRKDVERYDKDLRNLGLADADLDRDPRFASPWLLWLILAQFVFVFLLLPPFLVLGFVVNAPVAIAIRLGGNLAAKLKKDRSSNKVLLGLVLFPLAWIAVGIAGYRLHKRLDAEFMLPNTPALAGMLLSFLSIAGGAAAYRYVRVARETARSVRVRLTRRRRAYTVARLRKERGRLHDELLALQWMDAAPAPIAMR